MDPGTNDYRSGNVNADLRNSSYRVSTGIPILDDSMQGGGYAESVGQEKAGSFLCLNRAQVEYLHSHPYTQSSTAENDRHYLSSFNELPHSGSRKHSLSGVVRTRRRKAGISEEERVCIVCGEPASGYNFDRLTCESCKAFFRRNALKPRDKIKACNRGGGCAIEGNQRKHCPSCRLEKCLAVGMKRELILPPEKLEQRAKPRRRKHHSPQDSSSSPQHLLTGPSSVGSSNATAYPSYLPSPLTSSHQQVGSNQTPQSSSYISGCGMPVHLINSVKFPGYLNPGHRNDLSLTTDTFNSSGTLDNKECSFSNNSLKIPLVGKPNELFIRPVNQGENQAGKFLPLESSQQSDGSCKVRSGPCPTQCRRTGGRTFCQHRSCRLRSSRKHRQRRRRTLSSSKYLRSPLHITSPDPHLLSCLQGCIRRIREPFTPDEQLETGVAVTLEQEYNRMDACIRRIIRVVKLLPYFSEVGKPAQLSLLRTNIYGLIVLYSSFFFERDIRKLRYPVLQSDGQLTTVTVSMLDEVATPSATMNESDDAIPDSYSKILHNNTNIRSVSRCRSNQVNYAIGLREEFELYKSNTLAAFDHLDELVGSDDILRMSVLAIKLFSDNSLTEDLRAPVCAARQAYSLFLWNYIRWQAGSKRLRSATELYARILIAFIDLRTLEIRMTEFAKLLSLDGLSPLMREVCSQRSTLG